MSQEFINEIADAVQLLNRVLLQHHMEPVNSIYVSQKTGMAIKSIVPPYALRERHKKPPSYVTTICGVDFEMDKK